MIFKCIIYIVVLSEFFRNIADGKSLSGSNDSETIDRSDNSVDIINAKNSTKADIVVSTTDRHNYSELVWEVFGKTIIKPQLISNNTTEEKETQEKNSSDNNPLDFDRRTIWSRYSLIVDVDAGRYRELQGTASCIGRLLRGILSRLNFPTPEIELMPLPNVYGASYYFPSSPCLIMSYDFNKKLGPQWQCFTPQKSSTPTFTSFSRKQTFSPHTTRYTRYEELTEALKADSAFKDVKVDVSAIEVTPTGVELSGTELQKYSAQRDHVKDTKDAVHRTSSSLIRLRNVAALNSANAVNCV
uniref:Uncharacterized protein n=1 Tax=Glossina austeni TaxID=7395 RepID=A0A1A9UED6_GLOAU